MILETLIFRCLVQGTRFTNAGKTISLKVSPGETALFFKIDDNTKKDCLRIAGECCDCLVYFASAEQRVFCLAELKGKDTEHAAEQVINAYDHLSKALNHSNNMIKQHVTQCTACKFHFNECTYCKNTYRDLTWKAFIHQRGASPNMLSQRLAEALVARFGKHGEGYDISHKEDIGYLLRK